VLKGNADPQKACPPIAATPDVCKCHDQFFESKMGYQFYLCVGSIVAVWLTWGALTLQARESSLLSREVDERLRKSVELLDTLPGTLRR
jgi:hypothetical protein